MKVSFEIQGSQELARKLTALGPKAVKAASASLYRSAETIMTRSRDEFCPINTGALKSTGTVGLPEIDGSNVRVELGYGGPTVGYAIFVHEMNKNYNHGKQWKYLETPLKEGIPDIERNLNDDLDEALGKD